MSYFILKGLRKMFKSLILNPTENITMDIKNDFELLEGFYVADEVRDINNKIIFAGRNDYTKKLIKMKKHWCNILDASDVDFRYLSGLHAHIVTFMSLGYIGDTVLLLPENAGGHFSTEAILKRLGYNVVCAIPDFKNYCIDANQTIELIKEYRPQFAFIDRSEGLYYEDFSWLKTAGVPYCIFDGSQYLTQILTGIYKSPFDSGFDLLLSSTHKNYPGPQKAFLATKNKDKYWKKLKSGSATYISNSHPKDMFRVVSSIENINKLYDYSTLMLNISDAFETCLHNKGFPIVKKDSKRIRSQHIWSIFSNQEQCYRLYCDLEKLGFLTNYRLLPYNLGYGLRIGIGAAIQQGLRMKHIDSLANIFSKCYKTGYSNLLLLESQELLAEIFKESKII